MKDSSQISAALGQIIAAGMSGGLGGLEALLDENVVMVFPGFGGKIQGKASMISGFEDFRENATVLAHEESAEQVDIVSHTAVGSYRFEVFYSRGGVSYHSTGRDMWVFEKSGGRWLAVWRTMLDVVDEPAGQ